MKSPGWAGPGPPALLSLRAFRVELLRAVSGSGSCSLPGTRKSHRYPNGLLGRIRVLGPTGWPARARESGSCRSPDSGGRACHSRARCRVRKALSLSLNGFLLRRDCYCCASYTSGGGWADVVGCSLWRCGAAGLRGCGVPGQRSQNACLAGARSLVEGARAATRTETARIPSNGEPSPSNQSYDTTTKRLAPQPH